MSSVSNKIWRCFLPLALAATLHTATAAYQTTISADFNGNTGAIDKIKLLNVARGGQGINSDLTWMPSFYDKLVEIGVREFRIDWLLSDGYYQVVSRNTSGQLVYDFLKLDQIIVPLAERGIKPIMCMAYLASALGPQNGAPTNYTEYKATIQAYVQHYMALGYSGWAWESHNEPEGFTTLTAAQTYQMYKSFAQAVKEADATARVGGYGSVGSDWGSYMGAFLDLYKADVTAGTAPPMDFFSTHQYGGDTFEQVTYAENLFFNRGLTPPDIYLTEWNNSYGSGTLEGNAGTRGGGYDTPLNAAYVAMKLNSAISYYWLRRACFFNFADTNSGQTFSGDLGLFTVNGHRKAAANVFWMYNRLCATNLPVTASGTGTSNKRVYAVVSKDSATNKVSLILWNFQTTGVDVSLTLNNLPYAGLGKNIRLNRHLIDNTHGNYYYDYLNGHTGSETGPNENAALIEASTLLPASSLTRGEYLPPFGVIQITLEATSEPVLGGKLTGTQFGNSPSYGNNPAYSYTKAFDGDITTFYNYESASGGYVGIDLTTPKIVTRVRFCARSGFNRMVGGKFQGSNTSSTTGFTDLHTITSQPPAGWNEVSLAPGAYRYLRYVGPANSYGEIAELEFYGTDTTPPAITPFIASVFENTMIGTLIGTLGMSDPDLYQVPLSASITAGNVGGAFTMDPSTGKLTLAAPLNAASQPWYDLQVLVSDNIPGLPQTSTATIRINVQPNPSGLQPGGIRYDLFDGVSGTTIADLTSNPRWPADPNISIRLPSFEGHTNRADSYGATLRGYVIPPLGGSYTFWIAGNNQCELWISPSENPTGISLIAQVPDWSDPRQWMKYAQQQSTSRVLTAGQPYYIEARMKENAEGDHLAVAWSGPATSGLTEVIPGIYLAPYSTNNAPRINGLTGSVRQGALAGTRIGSTAGYDVNNGDSISYSITAGNASGAFTIDSAGILRVANEAALLAAAPGAHALQITATDSATPAASTVVNATVNVIAQSAVLSGISREIWRNIPGESLTLLTTHPSYPHLPGSLETMSNFTAAQNIGDNHGSRVRAYLTPTQSGTYTFRIASNNDSALLLSTNDSPANAAQIASASGWTGVNDWTKQSSQTSAAKTLVGGQRYYIEALHKDSAGDDHLSVGWSGPGITGTSVIAASYLTPFNINLPPATRNATHHVLRTAANGTAVGAVPGTSPSFDPLTFQITGGNTGNTFAIHPDTGMISVANNNLLAAGTLNSASLTVTLRDSGCGGIYPPLGATSTVTIKTVTGPDAGLWAWLKFDETSGSTASDSSNSGNNASLLGGATFTGGRINNAVNLNGTGAYTQLPTGIARGMTDFTIALWVNLDTSPAWARLFDFGDGTTRYMFLTPKSGSNTLRFGITNSGSGGQQRIDTSPLPINVWKHVAVTLSGTVGTIHVDGVAVATNPNITLTPGDLGNTNRNWIGESQFSADPFLDGKIDDFRIYSRALFSAEISALATIQPLSPSSLAASTVSSGRIDLSWIDNSGIEAGYKIERKTGTAGTFAQIATADANTTSFSDHGLAVGTSYIYRVRAFTAGWDSGFTNEAGAATLTLIQDWRQAVFGTPANAGIAANTADDDKDGVRNLMEYALGMDPESASLIGLPSMETTSAPALTLTYKRARTDITYQVEAADDLGSWSKQGVNQGQPATNGTTTASVPMNAPKRFVRLAVDEDSP